MPLKLQLGWRCRSSLSGARPRPQVVLNKTDAVGDKEELARRWAVVVEEVRALRGGLPAVHMVSTATGAGVAALAAELCGLAPQQPPQ